MSDTLKIMVRETKTERRALTREEYFALHIYRNDRNSLERDVAMDVLEGINYSTHETIHNDPARFGNAEFCTEIVRDAKPREIDAWHVVQRNLVILPSACYRCKLRQIQYINAKKVLEDKEIILEVIHDK